MEQESNRQKTMEDTDKGLHPAVDGQSLGGMLKDCKRQNQTGRRDGREGERTYEKKN